MINITIRSKARQPLVLAEALLIHQGSDGGNGHPHPVRWWLSTTMAPTLRLLVVVTIPGHHEQGGRVGFEIRGEEWRCCSDSLKIERAVYEVQHPMLR
jgi:hypothetical protein